MDHWAGVPSVDEVQLWARTVPAPREGGEPCAGLPEPGPADAVRLELVARYTDEAIVVYGPDGRIDWVNHAFVRMTGYRPDEVVGVRRVDLIHGPFTRTDEFVRLADDLANRRDTSVEFVTRTKDGVSYWVALQVRAALRDGRVVALVGVERDVTARRHAEERAKLSLRRAHSLGTALRHEKHVLGTVLATIPQLVWWKNADLRYVGANPAYLAFRGLGSVAEVVGRLTGQLDPPDGADEVLGTIEAAVLASGEPVLDCPVTLTSASGDPRPFLVSVLPHRQGGEIVGVIGIGADVSRVSAPDRDEP